MMDVLQGIGYGIVGLAILVVVGIVVIQKLGDATATCPTGQTYNLTDRYCWNATAQQAVPTDDSYTTGNYLATQLGSTGLSGWVPAIIAVAVGALFLAYFVGKRR